jgi:hypothetical protein
MPEEQNVRGDIWHSRFNRFLEVVLRWGQLGDSSTDIPDPVREKRKGRGLDSVFAYKRNPRSPQQIVLVEAKTAERMRNIGGLRVQGWISDLHTKLERLPSAQEFKDKFQPETDAQYQLGLIGLWARDVDTYSHSQLQVWLSQVYIPKRKTPCHIGLIANRTITRLCAIHEEVRKLERSDTCQSICYHFPDYGGKPLADGSSVPFETIFSKFVFCNADMLQRTKGGSRPVPYKAYIAFYLGDVQGYSDLRFIGLALRQFQMLRTDELAVYTLRDPTDIRNEIANFKREFQLVPASVGQATDYEESGDNIEFRQLVPSNQLPGWIVHHD